MTRCAAKLPAMKMYIRLDHSLYAKRKISTDGSCYKSSIY